MLLGTVLSINRIDLFNDIVGDVEIRFQNRDCAEGTMVRATARRIGKIVISCWIFIIGFFQNIVIKRQLVYIDVIMVTYNGSICKQPCQNV